MNRYLLLIITSTILLACGVKPGSVKPPGDAEQDSFPRTYPDISIDPEVKD